MNTPLAVLAAVLSELAVFLPPRRQTFTRVTVDGHTMRVATIRQAVDETTR